MTVKTFLITCKTTGEQGSLDAVANDTQLCDLDKVHKHPGYYTELWSSSITTVQMRSVGVFWLTHYQPSQQETISKLLLIQSSTIYIPGGKERAMVPASSQSRSRLLA